MIKFFTIIIRNNGNACFLKPFSRGNQSRIDWYIGEYGVDLLGRKVEIHLWGRKLIARSQFASILVIPERKGTTLKELKVVMVTLYNNYVLINSFVF